MPVNQKKPAREMPTLSKILTTSPGSGVSLTARLAVEIPKPKDWQALQRNCVLLFRSELRDPNTQEYGRPGQRQGGIDILGRRDGREDHFVGIQCRLITRPLTKEKILSDCRASITLKANIKEIIFATTAPDDTGATDSAIEVERELRSEGHNLSVSIYGWGQLQTLIAVHDVAYNAFQPSAVATSTQQILTLPEGSADLAAVIATQVMEQLRASTLSMPPRESGGVGSVGEDPALHARIDTFRDLFVDSEQPGLAERGLLNLFEKEDLEHKPWARYRIVTNLGAVALNLGREADAAARFEAAYNIRPADSSALANLALARIIQGRFDEALEAARSALTSTPRADHAINYLLQAASLSGWVGDPETLIPRDLIGTVHADLGICEFLKRREITGWAERCIKLAERHADSPEFRHLYATSVLSLAIDSKAIVGGGRGPVTSEMLNKAADIIKTATDHLININFQSETDLLAHINNTAVLLRLCERDSECEIFLLRGIPLVGENPQLRRLLALAQFTLGRREEALYTLREDKDPENQILRGEFIATSGNPGQALAEVLSIDESFLTDHLRRLRWRLIGELSLTLEDNTNLTLAISGLRTINPDDIYANLFEILREKKSDINNDEVQEKLRSLADRVSSDIDMASRYMLAEELRNQELSEEAAKLLETQVDLSRPSPAASLYLECLASARRDAAFREALSSCALEIREDPRTLWIVAVHAWNLGDLNASFSAIESLLKNSPNMARARLLKIEILVRQDRSADLLCELDLPIESLTWRRPQDQFRVAALLGHFGYVERAAALAYRLFLEHRDTSRAWMTLSMLVLHDGRSDAPSHRRWEESAVGPHAAVDLLYDDGSEMFFVFEPDVSLRKLDYESWEPDHALIRILLGLSVGSRFIGPDGREGVIRQIRHKYVARLHYVLEHHETRFPEIMGFRRLSVDPSKPGGLDEFIAELKARHDWIKEEEEQYKNGPWPLTVLAHRLGMDTIEVAAGLSSHGIPLKVAKGTLSERNAAEEAIRINENRGCVLDLLALWTAWKLKALTTVESLCGRIHIPQSVLDQLRARREKLGGFRREGLRSAGYSDGKVALQEISADLISELVGEIDDIISWVDRNATVLPLIASEEIPKEIREHIRSAKSDMFDGILISIQRNIILISDDLFSREFGRTIGADKSTWLQIVFNESHKLNLIDADTLVRWLSYLLDAGHNYLGINAGVLLRAIYLDRIDGQSPGFLLKSISSALGGVVAEAESHTIIFIACVRALWSDDKSEDYRQPVTSYLLMRLLRGRTRDFEIILRSIFYFTRDIYGFSSYLRSWLIGHFMPPKTLKRILD